jgi:putative oxidoreductase
MAADRLMSYGVLLLRLALGTMFIAHSVVYMLLTLTLAGTVKFFASIGLPAWIAYATILARRSVDYCSYWAYRPAGWRWPCLQS